MVVNGNIARLTQLLETCPKDGRFIVDGTSFVDRIEQLVQTAQRSQELLDVTKKAVIDRCQQWASFEDSANAALKCINRLNYARNMASLERGTVDLSGLQMAKIAIEVFGLELIFSGKPNNCSPLLCRLSFSCGVIGKGLPSRLNTGYCPFRIRSTNR